MCSVFKEGINCQPKDTILEANRKDLVLLLPKIGRKKEVRQRALNEVFMGLADCNDTS